MGILSRISKVLESNLTALVERAEDPAKLLEQAIEDMKKGKDEARQALIEAKTQKRILEKKRDKSFDDAAAFERRAIQALKGGDDELARRCLEQKLAAEHRADAESSAASEQEAQIAQLELAERELDRRLAEMPARRAALLARQAAAHAKGARTGASGKARSSVASALEAFDRMEERIIRAEVEAEVLHESDPGLMLGPGESDADRALEALRARIARELPAGDARPAPRALPAPEGSAPADPVEDSLAALKAKLEGGR
jgi:phage shock protein A